MIIFCPIQKEVGELTIIYWLIKEKLPEDWLQHKYESLENQTSGPGV